MGIGKQEYMKTKEFQATVVEAIEKINSTLLVKGKEYARHDNPFHNFEEGTHMSFLSTRESVAWEFMVKHLQSFKDLIYDADCGNHKKINKPIIDEKCIDIINYTLLIRAMLIERANHVD